MKKDRLDIKKIKVISLQFFLGREALANLVESKSFSRQYPLDAAVLFRVFTNQGTLEVSTEKGFFFDGRSGTPLVDFYAPNLGTLNERASWLAHDVNGYALDLSFKDTNILLFAMLRDCCGYRKTKASFIRWVVGLSDSWYGTPKKGDPYYKNIDKVHAKWIPSPTK